MLASALHLLPGMFLFRSLTIGLLGACILLIARIHVPPQVAAHEARIEAPTSALDLRDAAPPGLAIIDVAAGARPADVTALIRLSPGERVVAVDDRRVESDLAAGAAIANRTPGTSRFVDLDVQTAEGPHRRVLVLFH